MSFGGWTMAGLKEAVGAYAAAFDAGLISATDAKAVVAEAAACEHMLAGVKAKAAARLAATEVWRPGGDRSPAHYLARTSGTSLTAAQAALDTAQRLEQLPKLDEAVRAGEVSPAQASAIADAATADPSAEARLLQTSELSSLGELKDECARTKAAALRDAEARHRAIHRSRFLRQRRSADGAVELHYRSTPEEAAEILSVVQGYANREFHRARLEGRREPEEAYLADGLLEMARTAAGDEAPARDTAATPAPGGGRRPGLGPLNELLAQWGEQPVRWNDSGCDGAGPAGQATVAPLVDLPGEAVGKRLFADLAGVEGGDAGAGEAGGGTGGCSSEAGITMAPSAGGGGPPGPEAPPGGAPPARGSPGLNRSGRRRDRRRPLPTKVIVRIDWDALIRGWPAGGEVCELAGIGPVPVPVVRAMVSSGDAVLAAVVTRGVDVATVAHLGRRATAHQATALEWRSPTCAVEGCNNAVRLEKDHVVPWAGSRITLVEWLEHLCSHHHDLKTNHGWALVEGVGKRAIVPPDDPRHPEHLKEAGALAEEHRTPVRTR